MEIGGPAPDAANGQATLYLHHWGSIAHQLRYSSGTLFFEAAGNGYGTTATPTLQVNGPLYAAMLGGKVGIGTSSSTSKVAIQPESTWSDEVPLFEVKNKLGVPVLAVYNNGVRILVDHTMGKGIKSGFAVGGYDMTKAGKTVDFMVISPDSIRFNINNDNTKAVKSGFAVGGYDATKGAINQDFMYITPQNSANGLYNTFIGYHAGQSTISTGNKNTFIGFEAGMSNTGGDYNVCIGESAGRNGNGTNNVYLGQTSGKSNSGNFNVFLGTSTGYSATAVSWSTFIGNNAGASITTAHYNTLIGSNAGASLTTGEQNTFIGTFAGWTNNTGSYNTIIGQSAGETVSGSYNVLLGYKAGQNLGGLSDRLYISNSNTSSPLIWGNFSSGNERVRINGDLDYTGALTHVSDARLKTNISQLDNVIESLKKIRGVQFDWNPETTKDMVLDRRPQIGVLAQEIEIDYPELISVDEKGYKSVDYLMLTPVLIEAIK